MLTVRCAKCKKKIFKYEKIGEGHLLRCWKSKIRRDYSVRDGREVKCPCGNLIGIEENNYINMKQHHFICSGSVTR